VEQAADLPLERGGSPGWAVVLGQELRDLWLGGRGLLLSVAFSLLLSVIAYLVATNTALNFLEHRESVNLVLQVAIAVGGLLTLLAAADAVSGERERGTLESVLLSPVARSQIAIGKVLAPLPVLSMYGMFALQETVRQVRGTAPAQVKDAQVAVCHGVGGMFSASGTIVMADRRP